MATTRRLVKDPVSGFSHLAGLGVALVGSGWLLGRTSTGTCGGALVALVVYAVSLVTLYMSSSLYHLLPVGEALARRLRTVDHVAIFLFVAGTCTPVFHHALSGTARAVMLSAIWGVAVLGVVFKLLWLSAPRALYTIFYVAMGWAVVLQWNRVVAALPHVTFALIVAGGVIYTLGAVVYVARRPDPYPKVFGFHEIWHLFVLAGSTLHFLAIATLPSLQ
ncbi:MAG: hemolysin III family protein [Deltaproteobacteria bacterium]|nr:hemolysin III family protein [Deltaproteobacteria bacterium]